MLLPAAHANRKLPGFTQKRLLEAQAGKRFRLRRFNTVSSQKLQHRTGRDSKADVLDSLPRAPIEPYRVDLCGHETHDLGVSVQDGPAAVARTNVSADRESRWIIGAIGGS